MLCNICPRRCGAERTETRGGGVCAMPAGIVAAKAMLHQWEEPVLSGTNGAGCVFFSGCNLGCAFCQNGRISHENFGKVLSPARLREIFFELIAQGAQHGINHTGQERPADQAADHTADDSQQRRPGHHAKDGQRRAGQKAQHAEDAGFIQRPQVAAQQFKKARNADLTALDGSFVCFV